MTLLYNIGIATYSLAIKAVSPFNKKAKLLNVGRKETAQRLKELQLDDKVVWIHAASLGEFEQGRPIIEKIKEQHPAYKIVLTFFSPSGYEVRKNFDLADHVMYLPADTKRNARQFLDAINPQKVFFIKYEFWYHFLRELSKRSIPVFGVSMIFRKEQTFFKPYGAWFRKMLSAFDKFYVQDEVSGDLLKGIGFSNYSVAGDTRFDRVRDIALESKDFDVVERFVGDLKQVIVAGSSWAPDEDILIDYIQNVNKEVKLIIAPHEIHDEHIQQIESKLKVSYFKYTEAEIAPSDARVLIINTIGMLSAIYKYGQVAYVGGGFGVGIHNTLEAATYSMPVFFGPNYKKFKEARDLIEAGGGFSIKSKEAFIKQVESFWNDASLLDASSKSAGEYVNRMCGATDQIMNEVFV
ncbi:3-deoxy-D-manno-octulosonic acid transferase [Carboxylicivirga sp. A043]|uniref:3-deoxy-D-manno-octulosonic acid transferase n=1 Tax=Carboxylicivirga litoralis TaxID=2816963 RepID=UPI0021CB252A|nr:glycosyltransferase N-terminal domain-containing protein [Carboxylicivirga sp. A043]MCU4157896.1 3-deoxy-D-manno-octulosonic acid transferase [Carboxylicivirga sp. A043]